jgi:YebC/PmpR family DNA-binding regulatory protein
MSGHSKWATIKHKKAIVDSRRGKLFTKLIKELTVAARMGGGDATANPRLRQAIVAARGQAMPNDTINRAVQRGTGEIEGADYEEILYEGTGPCGTLYLVAAMTDNRNRTAAEIRRIFDKNSGMLGGSGAAGWAFDRRGLITLDKAVGNEDTLMDVALGAGADDYNDEGETWQLTCAPASLNLVLEGLEVAKIAVKSSEIGFLPKNKKSVGGADAQNAIDLADALDDHDDVQNVYADFDISEEELALLSAG